MNRKDAKDTKTIAVIEWAPPSSLVVGTRIVALPGESLTLS